MAKAFLPSLSSTTDRGDGPLFAATVWDVRQAAGAALFAGLALAVAWLVTAATDEGSVAWSVRAARTLPLAPVCAALGAWLGQARAWARGEGRALATLGRGPLASSAAAVFGGTLVAWIAAAAIFGGGVDVSGFFPVARGPDVYVADGGGAFVETVSGYRIEADGSLVAPSTVATGPRAPLSTLLPPHARASAALSTAFAGLALPLLVAKARRTSRVVTAFAIVFVAVASIFLFHAAAVQLVRAMIAPLPALALVLVALFRFRAPRRSL